MFYISKKNFFLCFLKKIFPKNHLKKKMKNLKIAPKGRIDHYSIFIASRWFKSIEDLINLELSCPKFLGNMKKYFYNPIPLKNELERNLFPNLQTLYLYNKEDNKFLNDDKIKKRKKVKGCYFKMMYEEQILIENELKREMKEIIYIYEEGNEINWDCDMMMNKQNILIIPIRSKNKSLLSNGILFLMGKINKKYDEFYDDYNEGCSMELISLWLDNGNIERIQCPTDFYLYDNTTSRYSDFTMFDLGIGSFIFSSDKTLIESHCFSSSPIKGIIVIEMKQTKEEKRKEIMNEINRKNYFEKINNIKPNENEIKQIEQWSNKKFKQYLFDSNFDSIDYQNCELNHYILGKSNIGIIIELDNKILIGNFIHSIINKETYYDENKEKKNIIKCSESFLFLFENELLILYI